METDTFPAPSRSYKLALFLTGPCGTSDQCRFSFSKYGQPRPSQCNAVLRVLHRGIVVGLLL